MYEVYDGDGPEVVEAFAVISFNPTHVKVVQNLHPVTCGKLVPYSNFNLRLGFDMILVERHSPERNPEAGLQVIHR